MSSSLVEMYLHNKWANLKLIDFLADLPDEQLDSSAAGTFGQVRETLIHIVSAEDHYVYLLTGAKPDEPIGVKLDFPGLSVLRAHAAASGDELIRLAENDPYPGLLHPIRDGEELPPLPVHIPLIQAIHHATEHRTQIATILGQNGIEPPNLSGWAYNMAS